MLPNDDTSPQVALVVQNAGEVNAEALGRHLHLLLDEGGGGGGFTLSEEGEEGGEGGGGAGEGDGRAGRGEEERGEGGGKEGEEPLAGVEPVPLPGHEVAVLVLLCPGPQGGGQQGEVLAGGVLQAVGHPGYWAAWSRAGRAN